MYVITVAFYLFDGAKPYSVEISEIFSIHYFIAGGKKVKGMVKNDVFGDGVGRFMDFLSVRP